MRGRSVYLERGDLDAGHIELVEKVHCGAVECATEGQHAKLLRPFEKRPAPVPWCMSLVV